MSEIRRGLVPVELAAIAAVAIVDALAAPAKLPETVPLFAVATAARWLRGRSWAEVGKGGGYGIGAAAGAVALLIALFAGTPLVEAAFDRAVEWSEFPIVRGGGRQLLFVAILVAVGTLATELALRGWIVERALELGAAKPIAIGVGAIAEMVLTPGDVATRLGGALVGVGLSWMYIAAGRSVVAPATARMTFQLGALVLEALKLIG